MQQPLVPRRLAVALAASIFVCCAAPSAMAQQSPPLTTINVVSNPATPAMPFFYAKAHGMFRKAGLDVHFTMTSTGSAAELAVVGGADDIGFTNTLTLTNAVAKKIPLEGVSPGAEYDHSTPSARLMVLRDSPVREAADLDGKTVAVTGLDDLLSIATQAWTDQNGGNAKSIHFVEIPPGTMYAALKEHRVDAIADYDPFSSEFSAKGLRTIGYPFDGIAPKFVEALWFAKSPWLRAHEDAAHRFQRVMQDASAYATGHFKELIPLIASYSKLKAATLEQIEPEAYPQELTIPEIQPVINAATRYEHIHYFVATREIYSQPNEAMSSR